MLSQLRTVGSAVERFVDIEEVTGSIPVRSTTNNASDLRLYKVMDFFILAYDLCTMP